MKNALIAFGVMVAIFLAGFLWLNRKGAREKRMETMKAVVWFCLCNGCGWVWCSYLLAYLGRTEIAESLSKIALTDIVVVVLTYAGKALVEQLSKYNAWPDKPKTKEKNTDE